MPNKLIVLNPVINALIGDKITNLEDYLRAVGWYPATSLPGKNSVLIQTKLVIALENFSTPIIDSRCPKIVHLVKKEFPLLVPFLSPVLPILITGALMQRNIFQQDFGKPEIFKVITPCHALREAFQNKMEMTLQTWHQFKKETGLSFQQKILSESPVPQGFFDSLEIKVISGSGLTEAKNLLSHYNELKEFSFIELLGCEKGCINGDGL